MRQVHIGDNLKYMQTLEDKSIDLIVTDPPYGKQKDFPNYKDYWSNDDNPKEEDHLIYQGHWFDIGEQFLEFVYKIMSNSFVEYLTFMAKRINQFQRILKDDGSLYLQCDHTAAEYLKILLDYYFGYECYRNSIAWCYTGPATVKKNFPRKHDTIFFYSKGEKFNKEDIRIPYKTLAIPVKRKWLGSDMFTRGHEIERLKQLRDKGKIPEDYWTDINSVTRAHPEKRGYSGQKPIDLYKRMILASSNEGDTILDPFCGSGPSLIAAEELNRNWIGVDTNGDIIEFIHRSPLWPIFDEIEFLEV